MNPMTRPLAVMEVGDDTALVVPAIGPEAMLAELCGAVAVDVIWSVRLSSN